ncbi:electron transfer flavoprotein subunit beta [Salinicola avicenniae]|uniref:electron transfer flavoprotein subunit beta n=1 Tax=Salinicola avicenniae TaxID=2916836 RepID=UPI00207376E6|nr:MULTISPECIES: electron transfer flavoprotein subunit beta [unclassified Salinicola]
MTQPDNVTVGAAVKTVALVSSGRHPVSGRAGRAREDARAVEMGLSLSGGTLTLLHAGDADDAALPEYLGMYHGLSAGAGPGRLDLLPMAPDGDALPALAARLRQSDARLVLTGQRAECGEGSGMLPYLLAETLGWSIATGIAAIEQCDGDHVTVLQALPQGQRRRLEVALPCLLAVDGVAPAPRQSAFGPARRGITDSVATAAPAADPGWAAWQWQPARARPKRLKVVKSTNARDRFKAAAAKSAASGGQVLTDLAPDEAADRLLAYLRSEKVLAPVSDAEGADQ